MIYFTYLFKQFFLFSYLFGIEIGKIVHFVSTTFHKGYSMMKSTLNSEYDYGEVILQWNGVPSKPLEFSTW
jgi:hypothetical protein